MHPKIYLMALTVLGASTPALAAETLEPSGKWVLDYADTQCVASREYGSSSRPVTLVIRPAPNGSSYEFTILMPQPAPAPANELSGTVSFGNRPIKAWLLSYGVKNQRLFQYRISAADMEQARTATSVSLRPLGGPERRFSLEAMPSLLKGLEDCTRDLIKSWNGNEAGQRHIARRARGDLHKVFSTVDYPAIAVALQQGGRSRFLLLVDEKGAVAGCHVLEPSGAPVLDTVSCSEIRSRAIFSPALDDKGQPTRDTVVTPPIVWKVVGN